MDFKALLEMLKNPPEDGLPDSIYDDLGASYDSAETEWSSLVTNADATIANLQVENAALAEKNQALMAHNYELLMAAGVETAAEELDDVDGDGDVNDEWDDEDPSDPYANLFNKDDEDND